LGPKGRSVRMPLARYFLFVGAVLLAVLVLADAFLPKAPVADSVAPHHPAIRLYSDARWPEPVVLDTSVQTINSAQPAKAELDAISAPALAAEQLAKAPEAPEADGSINSREALAELKQGNVAKPQSAAPNKLKLESQRKTVRRQASQRMRLVWRQSPYDWYGSRYSW
jgi:hypothetical protein